MRTPPYLPFLNGPLSLAPGLRPIPPETWLYPDTEAESWLEEKRGLMRAKRSDVFASRIDDALLALAGQYVLGNRPPPEGAWETGLEAAAASVSDDLCLMVRGDDGLWRLEAASLCAPTFWRLDDKLGLPLGGLHAPVPGANPDMVARVHRMFDAVQPHVILERFNWTVQPGPERFTPSQAPFKAVADAMPEAGALDALWLRVERQTISKMPVPGAALFTIRVAIDPLRAALREPLHAQAFGAAWDGIDPVLAHYKGWPHYDRLVRAALAEAAAPA